MYLVSTKLVPAHIWDGGCAEVLLLMEIHYSKIDNAIPLIRGSGFHVNVNYGSLLHTLLEHTKHNTDRQKKSTRFFSGILQFADNFCVLLLSSLLPV